MRIVKQKWARILAAAVLASSLAVSVGACSSGPIGGDIVAPVTKGVNELQGAKVELVVGQMLNIDTESLAVDSYSAEIADAKVAKFTQGRKDGSAIYNPGIEGLAAGSTEVTMTNKQGGIQPLKFTVTVVAKK